MPSLIDSIYEAVLQPDEWETVIQGMAAQFSASNVAIAGYNAQTHVTEASDWRKDTEYLQSFAAYWVKHNFLWDSTIALPVGTTFRFDTIVERDQLERSPIYNEWFRPQDMEFVLGTHLLTEGPWSVTATLYRATDQGEFDSRDMARFAALLPHLQRATQLRARLARADLYRSDLRSALDTLDRAAILVDREAKVAFANDAAERLFEISGLTVSRNGHLSVPDPAQSRLLRGSIADCLGSQNGDGGASMVIHRPHGRPLTIIVSRLPPSRSVFDVATALVLIDDPDCPAGPSCPDLLRAAYGLTGAEARLALALVGGRKLRDVADEFGITFATGRTHLAHIFHKTGVSSQAQLVRLLLRSGIG
jgi:DNA-binding CsgD family transcriptional regulator/PAS domain-containing protein